MRVIAFNDTTAILSDGQTIPVTRRNEAAALAGPDADGNWYAINLVDFVTATTH